MKDLAWQRIALGALGLATVAVGALVRFPDPTIGVGIVGLGVSLLTLVVKAPWSSKKVPKGAVPKTVA